MSACRSIGEIVAEVVQRVRRVAMLRRALADLPSADLRRRVITLAMDRGDLGHAEAAMLIEAFQLETA